MKEIDILCAVLMERSMNKLDRGDYILLSVMFGAFATIILASAAESNKSEVVASWFEALGVAGALLVAILIPLKTERSRRLEEAEERGMRTYSVAHSLTGAIWLLEIEVSRARRRIQQQSQQPPAQPFWQDWARGLKLSIPPALPASLPLMHGLQEDIIGPFRTAAMLADTFNGYTEQWAKTNYVGIGNNWPILYGQIQGQLILLGAAIHNVQRQFPGQG